MNTEELADNDTLASYLAKRRGREVNIGMTDIQILRRDRSNWRYLLCVYWFMSSLTVVFVWSSRISWARLVPTFVFYGAFLTLRKLWSLDGMIEYCLTRDARGRG
jgi:hypothetical protein